ncbi:MAG: hypothetical protein ACRCUW_16120 [Plesiomonas shigelloides]
MRKDDCAVLSALICVILIMYFTPTINAMLSMLTHDHAYIMSGVKFSLLATFGEILGKRISSKSWKMTNFGILPKMAVWFFLGVIIKAGFVVFATGMPNVVSMLNIPESKIINAFAISVGINTIFAPMFMTMHKITDMHINDCKGKISALITPIDMAAKLSNIDWNQQYGFVFKKTIPFFWIPAHTITFLLPEAYQVVFAAMLGTVLGVILSLASMSKPQPATLTQITN